ncbi:DUF2330 domain-containing protein [Hyphomonas chukchiensis]|uniref:DUF2330 domain-containing protein n=1 Tax=Hyphomonas chukchiensis TaxID=1280947 RepID=A0A062ULW6_9PROT|nr:DUF2330 domain-containing protein [Hyphomonas chukchiensis]KCZ60899.1 hypothetical protein HY30_00770 [Hyphomonas chukchiensis]
MKLKHLIASLALPLAGLAFAAPASAFCGFYVAKADTDLFNDASKVVLARDGDRTVITMASDFRGDVSEFAMVVPVVSVPEREQINVANPALVEHLDAYTAPRLVEYYDENPCELQMQYRKMQETAAMAAPEADMMMEDAESLGVTIEAEYEVGEYDILILSAEESDGLIKWLNQNGYKIPDGAEETVGAYLKRGMKFFVAKVSLERHDGSAMLRPIQVAYEDEDFMLPIRLGTVNAEGKQELFVFALTSKGRVETSNYRTVKLPSDMDVPIYVKDEFADFYKAMFSHQVEKENGKAVFMEYAWDMSWCDPCAAEPLANSELRELGVMWLDDAPEGLTPRGMAPSPVDVFVTRLHLRYDAKTFPEDLTFEITGDRENYQGRYVLRHPWRGDYTSCSAASEYASSLVERWDAEAVALAKLTGWDVNDIRDKMADGGYSAAAIRGVDVEKPVNKKSWWKRLWGNG